MKKAFLFTTILFFGGIFICHAGGELSTAMEKVNSDLKDFPTKIKTFLNIMAVVLGGYGAIRVYSKHQNGDQDVNKAMGQYGFAFIFVIVARLLVDTIFGA